MMRMSYAIPHANGRFYLPARVREWLQVGRNLRLHGRLIDAPSGPNIILSPIPFGHWSNCFRIIVNTCERVGSLHEALGAITQANLNVLHMVAAAASPAGDLTVTVIAAHIPDSGLGGGGRCKVKPSPQPAKVADAIERQLKRSLGGWLSRSSLYGDRSSGKLETVKARPLLVLRALAQMPVPPESELRQRLNIDGSDEDFAINMRDGLIDLSSESLRTPVGRRGPSLLWAMGHPNTAKSVSLTVAVDPEEYHFRIGLLPARPYMMIDIPLLAEGREESSMMGLTKEFVGIFRESCPTNIFYASSTTVEANATSGKEAEKYYERMRLRVVGDVTSIGEQDSKSPLSVTVGTAIKGTAARLSKAKSGEKAEREVRVDLRDRRGVTVRPLLAPLVFTATNAKRGMRLEHIDMAIELCAMLKDLHLRPVFVPTITGAATAQAQMIKLLSVSPMLVSLYLPEHYNRLQNRRSPRDADFAPSAWTMFEEAYLTAVGKRQVFRLLHQDVFPPPFIEPTSIIRFETREEYQDALRTLRERILACMEMDEWRQALLDCSTRLATEGVDFQRVERSDPEAWLLNERSKRSRRRSDSDSTAEAIDGSPLSSAARATRGRVLRKKDHAPL